MKSIKSIVRWAALWRSENRLDGKTEYIICEHFSPVLFKTRKQALEFIDDRYGYIRERKDIREEPHGWKTPRAVKVKISILK